MIFDHFIITLIWDVNIIMTSEGILSVTRFSEIVQFSNILSLAEKHWVFI